MTHIPTINDGSGREPRLRIDLNVGVLEDLPSWSAAPCRPGPEMYRHVRAAGYEGLQGADPKLCRAAGIGAVAMGRIERPGEAYEVACRHRDDGFEAMTLHVATEYESDDSMAALAEDIVEASARAGFPLYIETHRATITQDPWRTIQLTRRVPGVRFNGDFSHYYTGTEMWYGDVEQKLALLEPVFDRVRYMHGRIGNSSCIQVDVGDGTSGLNLVHFREIWTRAMLGFLKGAAPGDVLIFCPELLKPAINYARVFRDASGAFREESDRWEQSLVLVRIARECFAEAQRRFVAG